MRTSEYLRNQVAEVRDRRGLSQQGLAERLRARGELSLQLQQTIARVEGGDRRVTVDDLLALAAVLNVSPTTLLLPDARSQATRDGDDAEVHVTAGDAYPSWLVRSWIEGNGPLGDGDEAEYVEMQPLWHQRRQRTLRDPAVGATQALLMLVQTARLMLEGDEPADRNPPRVLAESLRTQWQQVGEGVEYLARELERKSGPTRRKGKRS